MGTKAWILGVAYLLTAVVVACGGSDSSIGTTPPTVEVAVESTTRVTPTPVATLPASTPVATLPASTPVATLPASTPAISLPPPPDPIDTLDVGMANLGPYVGTLYEAGVLQNKFAALTTHETLFAMGHRGEWEYRLVKGFDVSHDALTYTLDLQDGAEWHDVAGEDWGEFNADDFIWSIGEITREGSNHAQAGNTRKVFTCDGCMLTKIDDYTVELKRPTPTIQLAWFSQAPLPAFSMNSKRHFESVGWNAAVTQDVGTGPWQQVEYRTDNFRRMSAVENHWRKTPEFAEMVWWDIPDESVRLALFLAGGLDTGVFDSESVYAIQDAIGAGAQPDVKAMIFPASIIHMLWHGGGHYTPDSPSHRPDSEGRVLVPIDDFYGDYRNICDDSEIVNGVATEMTSDNRRPWVSCNRDVDSSEWERARKVREAMLRAIDRDTIMQNFHPNSGEPWRILNANVIEPWYIGIWANRGRMQQLGLDRLGPNDMDYDQTAARNLLAEAGYPDGFTVRVNKRLGTGTMLLVKDAVARDWIEVGIDVILQDQQPDAYRVQSQARRTIDIYGLNDAPSFPEPLRGYSTVYSSSSNDMFGVNHPEIDRLIRIAETTFDTDARWRVQGDIARFIYENVLAMPLHTEFAVWPLGAGVDSWQPAPAELDWLSNWEYARRR